MHRPTTPLPLLIQGGESRSYLLGSRGNPSADGWLPALRPKAFGLPAV